MTRYDACSARTVVRLYQNMLATLERLGPDSDLPADRKAYRHVQAMLRRRIAIWSIRARLRAAAERVFA